MIFAHLKIHALQIKEIVILMMNVRMAFSVDQTIVRILLDFILSLIAVMPQLLEMKTFVQLQILVVKIKEIVILTMSAKLVLLVDQIIVQLLLVLALEQIVVIQIHALVPVKVLAGKVIMNVMMETTIVDVNGMEETVVVIM